jgi:hypothetical protein
MNGFALPLCSFTNAIIASESASVLLKLAPLSVSLESMEKNISTVFNQLSEVGVKDHLRFSGIMAGLFSGSSNSGRIVF